MILNIISCILIVPKPNKCPRGWVSCYVTLLVVTLIVVIGMIVFSFIPKAGTSSTLIYEPDVVYITLPSNAPLIDELYLKTNGTCYGTLYSPPCDQVNITYQDHYVPTNKHHYDHTNHIYCLNGSEFVFSIEPEYNGKTEQVWVFTDKYAKLRGEHNFDVSIDCNNPPPDSKCRQLDHGNVSIPAILPANVGQYYYVFYNLTSVRFYVRRYYYPFIESDYAPYSLGPINHTTPISVKTQKEFQPQNIKDPGTCLFMKVKQCDNTRDPQYVSVTSDRRDDLLVWFGVLLAITFLAILIVGIVHCAVKVVQFRKYHENQVYINIDNNDM